MKTFPLDIIVPVWNSPIVVRDALASFVSDSPESRVIMINNGSERETELILDEFAEALDERALLIATARNIGSVAALNLGLSRATAPLVLITNPYTRLSTGWFDSVAAAFSENPKMGLLSLVQVSKQVSLCCIEVDHGSFQAMVIRKELFDAVGGFDEQLDGSTWTLRDYTRKAYAAGYLTYLLPCRQFSRLEFRELGSDKNRIAKTALSSHECICRWGEQITFFFNCTESVFGVDIDLFKDALLNSARQGNKNVVAVDARITSLFRDKGFAAVHSNISFNALPRFFSGRKLSKLIDITTKSDQSAYLIADTAPANCNLQRLSFHDFLSMVDKREETYFKRGNRCSS